jgi:hypothetical protein
VLAYDSSRNRIVLFGGSGTSVFLADTWEWDGSEWTQIADTGPAARQGHGLAFDSKRQRVVLFGGTSQNNQAFADTWSWNGTDWTQEQDSGPSARFDHKLAYDSARDRLVLFGGTTVSTYTYQTGNWWSGYTTQTGYNFNPLADTWEYDGTQWARVGDTGPAPRRAYGLDYDTINVLLYGGLGTGALDTIAGYWPWIALRSGNDLRQHPAAHGAFRRIKPDLQPSGRYLGNV